MWTPKVGIGDDYEGWVAWLDEGQPIFEASPKLVRAAQVSTAGLTLAHREADGRTTMDWKHVPVEKVNRLELYWLRHLYPAERQPLVRIDRPRGDEGIRFIQYKGGAVQLGGGIVGQQRAGVLFYRLGFWDKKANVTKLIEVSRTGEIQELQGTHPCWPKPLGFGINPVFVGLKPSEVPDPPNI